MNIKIAGIPTSAFETIRNGGGDAYGQPALRRISEGAANPCRHCLQLINQGEEKLVLSYRPFTSEQPYAEIGPIFLHSHACERYVAGKLPQWFAYLDPALIRGYDNNDWIRYETGHVVTGRNLEAKSREILSDATIAYVHIRSKFNCFQCRVDRGVVEG